MQIINFDLANKNKFAIVKHLCLTSCWKEKLHTHAHAHAHTHTHTHTHTQCSSQCSAATRPPSVQYGSGVILPGPPTTCEGSGVLFIALLAVTIYSNQLCNVLITQIHDDKILIRVYYKAGSYQTLIADGEFNSCFLFVYMLVVCLHLFTCLLFVYMFALLFISPFNG